eukprot:2824106-Pleurochrysis_carterae.AAC.3
MAADEKRSTSQRSATRASVGPEPTSSSVDGPRLSIGSEEYRRSSSASASARTAETKAASLVGPIQYGPPSCDRSDGGRGRGRWPAQRPMMLSRR